MPSLYLLFYVSIHSLTQRETFETLALIISRKGFNPLPHAEGDHGFRDFLNKHCVSIHSLTQRETQGIGYSDTTKGVSIHSLTQRETPAPVGGVRADRWQSTPARRVRQRGAGWRRRTRMFQSTPSRRGRHYCDYSYFLTSDVSIHSLTQRETTRPMG